MRIFITLFLPFFMITATGCGAPQTQSSSPALRDPVSVPETSLDTAAVVDEHVYYQLFWLDIHVLTIYRGSGSLRSEDRNHPADVFSGDCSYMSAISHYFEHEATLRALIDRADSLENFFEVLETAGDYEVREEQLDAGY
mgnify:CR=1 FL=1